jgi:hypothetical protein
LGQEAEVEVQEEGVKMNGAERIAAERKRQVEEEKWSPGHDDTHDYGELAWAAVCYAAPDLVFERKEYATEIRFTDPWPWDEEYDKRPMDGNTVLVNATLPTEDRIRQLEKAGALIAAEIDRLLRVKD